MNHTKVSSATLLCRSAIKKYLTQCFPWKPLILASGRFIVLTLNVSRFYSSVA
ncbi:hypothetical protein [Psychromonas antarctica]|uniref:hypothetical protein n=1 Tax=Psychromonas antarctica TaxID=67573 RepID=UPI001EE9910F|nr:hypothetical protein [Psychromonas antarctica]